MTPTAGALLGFASWAIFLVVMIIAYRSGLALVAKRAANSFRPEGSDLPPFGQRLTRAHANCVENLPAAGAIMLYAVATNQTDLTDGLAAIFLGARFLQSLVHLASTSGPAVIARFALYLVQIGILGVWLVRLSGLIG